MISIANELDALRWDILGGSTTTQQAGGTYKGPNASWLEDLIALFNSRWFYGHSLKKEMMIKRPNTTAKQCDYRKVSEIEWWWNMVSSSFSLFSLFFLLEYTHYSDWDNLYQICLTRNALSKDFFLSYSSQSKSFYNISWVQTASPWEWSPSFISLWFFF